VGDNLHAERLQHRRRLCDDLLRAEAGSHAGATSHVRDDRITAA
jgi:hypothetical protein